MNSFEQSSEKFEIKMLFIGIFKLTLLLLKITFICFLIVDWWFSKHPIVDHDNSLMKPFTGSDGW